MISRVIGVARTVGLVLGCLLLLQHASAQHLYIRAINTLGAAVTDLTADDRITLSSMLGPAGLSVVPSTA